MRRGPQRPRNEHGTKACFFFLLNFALKDSTGSLRAAAAYSCIPQPPSGSGRLGGYRTTAKVFAKCLICGAIRVKFC